jgi:hypothetical protein
MSIRRMMLFTLGAKIKNLIDAFKTRVLADFGIFEAESCLNTQLTELDNDNLLDSASLIVTPNAYKQTRLYSVVPNNTTGDMVVTRSTTATRVNSSGLIENVAVNAPRIDYSNGSCPSILVEPQRTNLVFPSQTLTTQTRTVTAVAHTLSFYGTGMVTLSGVAIGVLNGTGANNRVTLTFTPTAGSLILTVIGSVMMAQLEAGSNATSYIPTVASTVTRNADVISKTGISSLIGQTEGTIYVEVDLINSFVRDGILVVIRNQASPNNRIQIVFGTTGNIANNIAFNHVVNGVANLVFSNTIRPLGISKIAVTYKNGSPTIMSINGVNYQTVGNVGAFTASINQFVLGSFGDTGAAPLNDSIKISYLLPSYLTVNQLNNLTTL